MLSPYSSLILRDGPLAYLPLNDAVGAGGASDLTDDGFTGGVSGIVTFGQASLLGGGNTDTAVLFGTGGSIALPAALSARLAGTYTWEAWATLPASPSTNQAIVSIRNDSSSDFYLLQLSGGKVEARFRNSAGTQFGSSTITVPTGAPCLLQLTYDGATLLVYANNVVVFSVAASGRLSTPIPSAFIGNDSDGNHSAATIGHAALYGYALSASQISAHYQAGINGPQVVGVLDPRQLTALQGFANKVSDTSFDQQRLASSQGPTRNVTETYSHLATLTGTVAQPSASLLANYDYRVADQATYLIALPVGTDIRPTDRLITSDGQKLDVQIVLTPESYPLSIEVIAAEVK